MNYGLPTTVEIDNSIYKIRNNGDYRIVLDIIEAINDPNLNEQEKAYCVLKIFYEDFSSIQESHIERAIKEAFKFIDGGDDNSVYQEKKPVMSWEQDFKWIVSPINRVLGTEIRSLPYLHWWTFLGAYYEIGDCFFAQIVNIRSKKNKGKKLEKYEEDFYKENFDIIKLKTKTTTEEDELLKEILGG